MTITIPENHNTEERNQWLRSILSKNIYEVTFTKIDGETRVMPCTLDERHLVRQPTSQLREVRAQRESNPATLSVYCTDKNAWRSFRVMNLISIKELE
jgi:hypothetical protein